MSSLLIIGELGESISVYSPMEFQTKLFNYIQTTNLAQTEISIFNLKGHFLDIKEVEFAPESRYFIYTKTYQKESLKQIFENSIHNLSCTTQIILNPNNLPDVHTHFSVLEENVNLFKGITPLEIKTTYERMLEFFENYKVFDTTMKLNRIICEKIKGNYQYQYCGINALIKNMNNLIDSTDSVRQELKEEYNKLVENKENCLKTFHESIEKLKTIELHPKMQNNDHKYLIDVYYKETKMIQSKDKIVDQFNSLSESIQKTTDKFLAEKNKVLNEKSTSISSIKFEWNVINSEFDKIFKEVDNLPLNIINDLTNEFLQFKKAINKINDILINNPTNVHLIEEQIDIIKMLKCKYSNFSVLGSLQKQLDPMNNYCSKMRKAMEKFSQSINLIFNNFEEIKLALNKLCIKYSQDKQVAEKLKESFFSLKYASFFPQAYQMSIQEVKRRLVFNKTMRSDIEKLKKVYNQEMILRNTFINQYGNYFPLDFLRIIKFYEIRFTAEFSTDESKELPNLLNEEEEKCIISNLNQSYNNIKNEQEINKNIILHELQLNIEKYTSTLSQLSTNLIIKNNLLKNKNIECENLQKEIRSIKNKYHCKSKTCPMCIESSINSVEYQSVSMFYLKIKKKYKEKENQIAIIEKQYQNLIAQIIQVKTTFFIHMNTMIAQKNSDIRNIKTLYEEKIKNLEDLLISEKTKNAKDINNSINAIQDNNQYDKQIKELNQLISTYQTNDNEKQKIIAEEKKNKNLLIRENKLLMSSVEDNKNTIQQLILNSQITSKKYSDEAQELINTIKMNTLLKEQNDALTQEVTELKNNVNQLKEFNIGRFNEFQLQKNKYEEIIKEKAGKIDEMIAFMSNLNTSNVNTELNRHYNYISRTELFIHGISNMNDLNTSIVMKDLIHYKSIDKGSMCIFVPHSEGIYVCVDLSEKIDINDEYEKDNMYYKCKYVLDLDSFKEDLKEFIILNSLIIIGRIGELKDSSKHTKIKLKDYNKSACKLVSLSSINYIIGFPGEELLFRNYQ